MFLRAEKSRNRGEEGGEPFSLSLSRGKSTVADEIFVDKRTLQRKKRKS